MIDIGIDESQLNRLRDEIRGLKATLEREVATAINATSRSVMKDVNKEIRSELLTTKKAVDKALKIKGRARPGELSVTVVVRKVNRIPLRDFKARQTKAGVSYQISRSEGRESIKSAFIVKKLGGHVFIRGEKTRKPIYQRLGPSPWGVFVKRDQEKVVIVRGNAELRKQIERRIRFRILERQGKLNYQQGTLNRA